MEVVGPYAAANGFEHVGTSKIGAVTFAFREVFLELSYDAHSYPIYHPTVALGFCGHKYGESGKLMAVPLWFVTRKSNDFDYSIWGFSSDTQLRNVLARIEAEVLDVYAKPLWRDPALLSEVIREFRVAQ